MHCISAEKCPPDSTASRWTKKLEESSEKTANLRRKKYTSPVPWSLFVSWNRPVWTLIKNMKSPDLWFLHCKTKNSRKLQKYHQCLESSKFEDKISAILGLEPLLVEIEHFLDIAQKYETPGLLIFTCQNAHRPPQLQDGQETWANLGKKPSA